MTQIRCICAWCGVLIRDGEEPASHGICARCRAIYFPPSKGWAADAMMDLDPDLVSVAAFERVVVVLP